LFIFNHDIDFVTITAMCIYPVLLNGLLQINQLNLDREITCLITYAETV